MAKKKVSFGKRFLRWSEYPKKLLDGFCTNSNGYKGVHGEDFLVPHRLETDGMVVWHMNMARAADIRWSGRGHSLDTPDTRMS